MKIVATTLRELRSASRDEWAADSLDRRGEVHVSPTAELDVYDRAGGGEGLASGRFYGLLTGASPEERRACEAVSPLTLSTRRPCPGLRSINAPSGVDR